MLTKLFTNERKHTSELSMMNSKEISLELARELANVFFQKSRWSLLFVLVEILKSACGFESKSHINWVSTSTIEYVPKISHRNKCERTYQMHFLVALAECTHIASPTNIDMWAMQRKQSGHIQKTNNKK